ncbi:MAG: GPW/gp25 family protein [Nitrososphaerales archaeon]
MAKSLYYGFNPPFYRPGRVMPVQTDERLIKNDLLQLLLTVPGERVFRPTFGTVIKSALHEPIDDISINDLKVSIADAIGSFEPRVRVSDIQITRHDDDNMLQIRIFASLTNEPNRTLDVNINVPIDIIPAQATRGRVE